VVFAEVPGTPGGGSNWIVSELRRAVGSWTGSEGGEGCSDGRSPEARELSPRSSGRSAGFSSRLSGEAAWGTGCRRAVVGGSASQAGCGAVTDGDAAAGDGRSGRG
jgi:hypothetical protein